MILVWLRLQLIQLAEYLAFAELSQLEEPLNLKL